MDVSFVNHGNGEQLDSVSDLRVRLTQLEHDLTQTNSKLSFTETALASLETRFSASEASCTELRQQVASLCAALESFRNENARLLSGKAGDSVMGTTEENCTSELTLFKTPSTQAAIDCCIPDGATEEVAVISQDGSMNVDVVQVDVCNVNDTMGEERVQVEWTSGVDQNNGEMQVESIADCVRSAAESAVVESNFVFDSRTGLYYDFVTGYYYDAEKSLYCEPQSGLYFYFDDASREYKYHSRVESTKQKLLMHIIYGPTSASSDAKGNGSRKSKHSKRLLKNTDNADSQRIKQKGTKLIDCAREKMDIADVYLNRKERRSQVSGGLQSFGACKSADTKVRSKFSDTMDAISCAHVRVEDSSQSAGYAGSGSSISSNDDPLDEREDGELDTSESECSDDAPTVEEIVGVEEMQNCTPCIRAMVMQSDCLAVGSLFVITCTGGTIGRDTDLGHSIVVPDPLISKMHCSISFDDDRQRYIVRDHASQAGTFVNNRRLAKAKTISEPHVVYHGDLLRLAGTTFDLHIHPRVETCSACEPGCLQTLEAKSETKPDVPACGSKERDRRRQLKKLKSKFGLTAMNYEDHPSLHGRGGNGSYQDRAADRRQTVGSDHPVDTHHIESASVHRPISEQNVGRKLLSKLGWKEGEGLGKNRDDAIVEPINVEVRLKNTAGLGAYAGTQRSLDDVGAVSSSARWIRAQDRYAKLSAVVGSPASADSRELDDVSTTAAVTRTAMGPIKWVKTGASQT